MNRLAFSTVLVGLLLAACDRAPTPDGLRDWTPADHDHAEESKALQSGQQAAPPSKASASPEADFAQLVELTWRQNCVQCHGQGGHGDGPNGALVKAPDLTNPAFQDKVGDDEMVAAIKNGKNLMPKFDFSDKVVLGLVTRIRATRGR